MGLGHKWWLVGAERKPLVVGVAHTRWVAGVVAGRLVAGVVADKLARVQLPKVRIEWAVQVDTPEPQVLDKEPPPLELPQRKECKESAFAAAIVARKATCSFGPRP